MKTLIKNTFAPALALGLIAAATPATAGEEGIIVQSQAAMEEWSGNVSRTLNRQLVAAERFSTTRVQSGIVQVRFTLDADGRADNLSIYRSSGHTGTDNVAKRALKRISSFADAPVRNAMAQTYQANIVFANDLDQHAALTRKLGKIEQTRLASGGGEADIVTLGG